MGIKEIILSWLIATGLTVDKKQMIRSVNYMIAEKKKYIKINGEESISPLNNRAIGLYCKNPNYKVKCEIVNGKFKIQTVRRKWWDVSNFWLWKAVYCFLLIPIILFELPKMVGAAIGYVVKQSR